MSRGPARTEQGERSRERILDAAIELIAERGFSATSVGEVSRRAGVAKTALYWHFESKEGLLAAVIERVGETWIEEIQKSAYLVGDPLQRVQRLSEGWRRIVVDEPQLLRLLMVVQLELGEHSAAVSGSLQRVWQHAERAIAQGIEDSVGASLPDLDLVAHTMLTLLQGVLLRRAVNPDDADLDRLLADFTRTVLLIVADRLPEQLRRELAPECD